MSVQYPRVESASLVGIDAVYMPSSVGDYKVVPADAIVIERGDLPTVVREGLQYRVDGEHYTWEYPPDSPLVPQNQTTTERMLGLALKALAVAEYAAAHPPVDEAQVEAAMPYIEDLIESAGGCRDGWDVRAIARRLVEQGWTNPEVSK